MANRTNGAAASESASSAEERDEESVIRTVCAHLRTRSFQPSGTLHKLKLCVTTIPVRSAEPCPRSRPLIATTTQARHTGRNALNRTVCGTTCRSDTRTIARTRSAKNCRYAHCSWASAEKVGAAQQIASAHTSQSVRPRSYVNRPVSVKLLPGSRSNSLMHTSSSTSSGGDGNSTDIELSSTPCPALLTTSSGLVANVSMRSSMTNKTEVRVLDSGVLYIPLQKYTQRIRALSELDGVSVPPSCHDDVCTGARCETGIVPLVSRAQDSRVPPFAKLVAAVVVDGISSLVANTPQRSLYEVACAVYRCVAAHTARVASLQQHTTSCPEKMSPRGRVLQIDGNTCEVRECSDSRTTTEHDCCPCRCAAPASVLRGDTSDSATCPDEEDILRVYHICGPATQRHPCRMDVRTKSNACTSCFDPAENAINNTSDSNSNTDKDNSYHCDTDASCMRSCNKDDVHACADSDPWTYVRWRCAWESAVRAHRSFSRVHVAQRLCANNAGYDYDNETIAPRGDAIDRYVLRCGSLQSGSSEVEDEVERAHSAREPSYILQDLPVRRTCVKHGRWRLASDMYVRSVPMLWEFLYKQLVCIDAADNYTHQPAMLYRYLYDSETDRVMPHDTECHPAVEHTPLAEECVRVRQRKSRADAVLNLLAAKCETHSSLGVTGAACQGNSRDKTVDYVALGLQCVQMANHLIATSLMPTDDVSDDSCASVDSDEDSCSDTAGDSDDYSCAQNTPCTVLTSSFYLKETCLHNSADSIVTETDPVLHS